jgi:hypothetical protein
LIESFFRHSDKTIVEKEITIIAARNMANAFFSLTFCLKSRHKLLNAFFSSYPPFKNCSLKSKKAQKHYLKCSLAPLPCPFWAFASVILKY